MGASPRHRKVLVGVAAMLFLGILLSQGAGIRTGNLIRDASDSADRFFQTFAWIQMICVGVLVPAYVAGSMARTKETRLLDFLLICPVSDRDILAYLLVPRLLQILQVMLVGLPILALGTWLGGIAFERAVLAYALTGALALSLAGSSAAISIHCRRDRDAVIGAYAVVILWFAIGWALGHVSRPTWIVAIVRFCWNDPPAALAACLAAAGEAPLWPIAWPALRNHTIFGVLGLAYASWRLRPIHLAQAGGPVRRRRPWLLARRPPVGDDPVRWWERYRPPASQLAWCATVAVRALSVLVPVAAFAGAWLLDDPPGIPRERAILVVNFASVVAIAVLVVAAVRGATAITDERERGTLEILALTPLSTETIVSAKLYGCLWSVAWPAAAMLALSLALAVCEPWAALAVVFMCVSLAIHTALFALVGLCSSATASNSTRALLRALVIALAITVLPSMCCFLPTSPLFTLILVRQVRFAMDPLDVGALYGGYVLWGAVSALGWWFWGTLARGRYRALIRDLDRLLCRHEQNVAGQWRAVTSVETLRLLEGRKR